MTSLKMLPAHRLVLLTTFLLLSQPSQVSPTCADDQCSTHFLEKQWSLTSSDCLDISVPSLAICSITCAADLDCLFFQTTCEQSCTCRICKNITAFDLAPTGTFYIRRKQFVDSFSEEVVWMSGGLRAGHITEVILSCDPSHLSEVNNYYFWFAVGTEQASDNDSLPLDIKWNAQTSESFIKSNFRVGPSVDAPKELFTFHSSSELNVVIFVDPEQYNIFVNGALFNTLPHSFKDFSRIQYTWFAIEQEHWQFATIRHSF